VKIHIVSPEPNTDRILGQLARMLAEHTGWSHSDRPVEGVDLNYNIVYIDLAQRFSDWRKTPWAAYFTHYEETTPYKVFWWQTADPLTKIKVVTTNLYNHLLSGHIAKVPPPVRRDIFDIRDRKANSKFTIGVSGYVDRTSGRKGERLAAIVASELGDEAEMVASGEGWPARCVNRSYEGLPAFYNSLDVYLCTGLVEANPMPPLEALACGVPVIIPIGVGMMDELPDIPGIFRYRAGDVLDLKRAVTLAREQVSAADREALRQTTAGYTPEAYAQAHVHGFKRFLNKPASREDHRDQGQISARVAINQHGQRGVYYVAYGDPARQCANASILSFKQHLPDIPIALVSDKPLGPEDVFIQHQDEDIGGRTAKVQIYDLAPADWSYIAYLDADTEIIASTDFLWRVIEDGWDMVICKNPARFHIASQMRRSDNVDECDRTFKLLGTDQIIQLNGGVFCFQRNARTKAFFDAWSWEWRTYGKRDQAALLRALWKNPLRLYVLGNEWNNITRYPGTESAWLNHYPMTARRWRGIVHYRLDDPAAWQAVKQFEQEKK